MHLFVLEILVQQLQASEKTHAGAWLLSPSVDMNTNKTPVNLQEEVQGTHGACGSCQTGSAANCRHGTPTHGVAEMKNDDTHCRACASGAAACHYVGIPMATFAVRERVRSKASKTPTTVP
eukprot:1143393-Pelagomonas_calceolata.AAC.3